MGDIRSRELMIFQRLTNRAVTIELSAGERLVGLRNEGGCFLRLAARGENYPIWIFFFRPLNVEMGHRGRRAGQPPVKICKASKHDSCGRNAGRIVNLVDPRVSRNCATLRGKLGSLPRPVSSYGASFLKSASNRVTVGRGKPTLDAV